MIDLTVKTLDSRNHAFSMQDDATVLQLKVKIEESMNIPANRQRLIFHGRVMQDDKKLSEYEVHGMVIHLVKSQPPQPGRPGGGSSSSSASGTNSSETSGRFTQPRYYGRVDGSTMFGSVVIPVIGEPGGGRHENRAWRLMSTADRMVQRAVEVLDNHENSASRSTSATASVTTTPYNSSRDSSGSHSPTPEPSQSTRAAGESRSASSSAAASQPANSADTVEADSEMDTESNTSTPHITVSSADQTTASSSASGTTGGSSQEGSQQRQQRMSPSTTNMAALLTKLRAVQLRFNPLLSRYHNLIVEDTPTNNAQQSAERVMITQTVPEILHLLSHAYHAISELTVDWEHPPPRQMRPLLAPAIQQLVQLTEGMNPWGLTIPPPSFGPQTQSAAAAASGGNASATPGAAVSTGSSTAASPAAPASSATTGSVPEVTYMTTTFPAEGGEATTTFTTRPAADFEAAAAGASSSSAGPTASGPPVVTASIDFSGARHPGFTAALNAAYAIANRLAAQQVGQQSNQHPQPQQQTTQSPQQPSQQPQQDQQSQPAQPPPPMSGQARGSSIVTLPVGMIDIPANVEFFMEVGPSTITIDSVEATMVTSGNFTPGSNGSASEGNPLNINFPWGSPPPQEFLNSVAQALNRIITPPGPNPNMRRRGSAPESTQNANTQRRGSAPESENSESNAASSTSGGTTGNVTAAGSTPSASSSPGATTGQTSQARGYTATHPTTSTQTRSTARPHVHHIAATQFPGYSVGYTDPFLPCHSQFFASWRRSRSSANNGTQTTPNDTSQSRSTQASATAASQTSARSGSSAPSTSSASTSVPAPRLESQTDSASTSSQSTSQMPNAAPLNPAEASILNLIQSIVSAGGDSSSGSDAVASALSSFVASTNQGDQQEVPIINWVLPQAEDQEGESLLSDLTHAVVRRVTVSDMIALANRNWEVLNRVRSDLHQFVVQRLCEGSPTEERVEQGANLLMNELRPHFDILLEATLRDDIDAAATLNRFHESVVPEFLKLVLDDERSLTFGQNFHEMAHSYLGRLWAIVKHCCANNDAVDSIFQSCVNRMPEQAHLPAWTARAYLSQLRRYTDSMTVSPQEIEPFIVYRTNINSSTTPLESSPNATNPEPSVSSSMKLLTSAEEVPAQKSDLENSSEPMDTDPQSPLEATTSAAAASSERISSEDAVTAKSAESPPVAMDTDVPPVPPPEAWHRILPPEWVPIIARDTTRQRRPNSQAPLSDAYLAGMPPKRRKVVTANKPQGSLSEVISANMETAIQSSGVSTAGISLVQEEAGSDPRLREAYREQLRATVRANLANNPDYSPDRFPNAAQYFGKS